MSARVLKVNLAKWAEKGMEAARLKAIDVCLEAHQGVMEKTPVDTGFCRAMWSAQINDAPRMKPVERGEGADAAVLAATAMAEVAATVPTLRLGDVVWVYNPVVYAPALENGHSQQAPNGMVGLTLAELRARYP